MLVKQTSVGVQYHLAHLQHQLHGIKGGSSRELTQFWQQIQIAMRKYCFFSSVRNKNIYVD